jgi:hypothetical protein
MNVNANVGRIAQQLPITKERIEKDLDFFMYFSDSHLEAYNPPSNEEFQKLTVDVNGTLASYNGIASKFLQDCESLFSEGTPQQKVGIFILLQRVADELGKLGK